MVDGEEVVQQCAGADGVGVIGVALRAVLEGPEAVDLYEAEAAQHGLEANTEVEKVQRQQTQTVDVEHRRVPVVEGQLGGVRLQHAVLQVACPEVEGDVQDIEEVSQVVQAEPHRHVFSVNLLKSEAVNDHPEVVQERNTHDEGPPVGKAARGVKHEGPFAAVIIAAACGRRLETVEPLLLGGLLAELFLDVFSSLFAEFLGCHGITNVSLVDIRHLFLREAAALAALVALQFVAEDLEKASLRCGARLLLHQSARVERRSEAYPTVRTKALADELGSIGGAAERLWKLEGAPESLSTRAGVGGKPWRAVSCGFRVRRPPAVSVRGVGVEQGVPALWRGRRDIAALADDGDFLQLLLVRVLALGAGRVAHRRAGVRHVAPAQHSGHASAAPAPTMQARVHVHRPVDQVQAGTKAWATATGGSPRSQDRDRRGPPLPARSGGTSRAGLTLAGPSWTTSPFTTQTTSATPTQGIYPTCVQPAIADEIIRG